MSGVTETAWRVEVDRTVCMGTGICASAFPAHFTLDGNKSRPTAGETAPDEGLLDAVDLCPMSAIRVTDTVTGDLVLSDD